MALPKGLSFGLSLLLAAGVAAARMPDTIGSASVPAVANPAALMAAPAMENRRPSVVLDAMPAFAASVVYHGALIAAPKSGGLVRVEAGALVPIDLGLTPGQREISAVSIYEDEVWLGTAAGLLRVIVTSCGHRIETVLPGPVRGMRLLTGGLWVAGEERTHLVHWPVVGAIEAGDDAEPAVTVRDIGAEIELERRLTIVEVPRGMKRSPLAVAVVIAP